METAILAKLIDINPWKKTKTKKLRAYIRVRGSHKVESTNIIRKKIRSVKIASPSPMYNENRPKGSSSAFGTSAKKTCYKLTKGSYETTRLTAEYFFHNNGRSNARNSKNNN